MSDKKLPSSDQKSQKTANNYLKYSGLAFQLFSAIAIGAWLGHKLDSYTNIEFPLFMLAFGMLAFGAIMVKLYRSIT